MDVLIIAQLLAQDFNPALLGNDINGMIQYGNVVGAHICIGVVTAKTRHEAIDIGVRQYNARADLELPGLMQYVMNKPDTDIYKQTYLNALDQRILSQCPKFFSLPK